MEQFSKFVASRLARQQHPARVHPDADALSAFTESRLKPIERKSVLAHLAVCPECREVVALISESTPEQVVSVPKRPSFNPWTLRWAAALAIACLITVMVVRRPTPSVQPTSHPVQKEIAPVAAPPPTETAAAPRPTKKQAVRRQHLASKHPAPPSTPDVAALQQAETALREFPPPQPASAMGFMPQRQLAKAVLLPYRQPSLWSLDANLSTLRRSDDSGRTWAPVAVNPQTKFLALSVTGSNIWAGGENGALFLSTDNGSNWRQVIVWDGTTRLTDAITAIETHPPNVVRLKTRSGDWLSSDGGASWLTK